MTMKLDTRTYSDLIQIPTFEDRFEYLKMEGDVGRATFGFDRYLNQKFYSSREWDDVRNHVIYRDNGCDLAFPGFEIHYGILIHHMNPISPEDIKNHEDWILDPEFLITTTHRTHNAIHYGAASPFPKVVVQRQPGDTRLW